MSKHLFFPSKLMEAANLVDLGMPPLNAIRSWTSLAAELLNVDEHTGKIAEGYNAYWVVIKRNPLENIQSLQDEIVNN